MKRPNPLLLLALAILLYGGQLSSPIQRASLQRELQELRQQGITDRFLDNNTIEISQEWSGLKRVKTLQESSEAAMRAWADTHGVPILEINPALVDTSRYAGWYRYWTTVPLSNDIFAPLVVRDADNNGRPEVYGVFKDYTSDYFARVYELDTTGVSTMRYQYAIGGGISIGFTDSDADGLLEYVLQRGDTAVFFEQPIALTLPTRKKIAHLMFQHPGTATWARVQLRQLDSDSLMDFLYLGSERDTAQPSGYSAGVYVAEYNPPIINFQRIWSQRLPRPGEVGFGGFTSGDFDDDGKMEFVDSELFGQVHVTENVSDNSYREVWRDSLPFVNVYYQTSGDVDHDGKEEFFIGATMSNGNWTTMFETDSSNHYSPKFIIHMLSGGTLDEPTYLTTDVDGDGRLELVIFSGVDLYVFKSRIDNSYYLWYYKRVARKFAVHFYDFDRNGIQDFIVSRYDINMQGQIRFVADIYIAERVTGIVEVRDKTSGLTNLSIYPNPFNSSITISYEVDRSVDVDLAVFDILGRKVALLAHGSILPGLHLVKWDANSHPSGIYFCNFRSTKRSITTKLLLVR